MLTRLLSVMVICCFAITACTSNSKVSSETTKSEFSSSVANPMLWRATLATLDDLPVQKADPVSGIITYDWGSFVSAPGERVKATVYILDTRLRADAVKVVLFREVQNAAGVWEAGETDPETSEQLEGKILERARIYSLNSL